MATDNLLCPQKMFFQFQDSLLSKEKKSMKHNETMKCPRYAGNKIYGRSEVPFQVNTFETAIYTESSITISFLSTTSDFNLNSSTSK